MSPPSVDSHVTLGRSGLRVPPICLGTTLSPELLAKIDAIRWTIRDPAQ